MAALLIAAAAAAQTFDPEAATRAYLSTLQGAARAKSDAYFEGGYWLILWGALVGVASHWLMLTMRWSAAWRNWAARVTKRRWLQPALYALPYVIFGWLIVLPWTVYEGFFREQQYGLMNMSFGGWLGQQGIMLGVTVLMTALVLLIVFAVIRRAPRTWWLWGAAALTALTAFALVLQPVFVEPLLNKYTPMPQGPLRDQILAMAKANHIPADNVWVVDASKQSKRISGNVAGLGPTIRIALNDNLLNRSTPAEVKAVMGHEMGHYVLGHVWKGLAVFGIVFLIAGLILWRVAPWALARWGGAWRVESVADPAVVPLFALILTVFGLVMTPVFNSLIRSQESQADAFGLDAAREPDGFASIAMKLSEYRKIEPTSLEEALFFDHPSGRTRVRMSMDWKARHLAELPPEQRAMVTPPPPAAAGPTAGR
ncbi:MAG: M48 family metallopeptidase [Alphaproteobacteria bacterium]|nr:M48 family metallopeptidase [Alphaproteobacteria bacterium]